jgi:hypothetical protein
VIVEPIEHGLSMHAVGFGQPESHYPESRTKWFSLTSSWVTFEMPEEGGPPTALLFSGIRAERAGEGSQASR